MDNWKPIIGRVSFLTNGAIPHRLVSALGVYQAVWGGSPQTLHEPTNPLHMAMAQGIDGSMAITCGVWPNRIDFVLIHQASLDLRSTNALPVINETARFYAQLEGVARKFGDGSLS